MSIRIKSIYKKKKVCFVTRCSLWSKLIDSAKYLRSPVSVSFVSEKFRRNRKVFSAGLNPPPARSYFTLVGAAAIVPTTIFLQPYLTQKIIILDSLEDDFLSANYKIILKVPTESCNLKLFKHPSDIVQTFRKPQSCPRKMSLPKQNFAQQCRVNSLGWVNNFLSNHTKIFMVSGG